MVALTRAGMGGQPARRCGCPVQPRAGKERGDVVTGPVDLVAHFAVARQHANHQVGLQGQQFVGAQAESLTTLREQVHHHDIRAGNQPLSNGRAVGVLQVELDRLLAPVDELKCHIGVVRTVWQLRLLHQPANRIASDGLDLDHFSPEVGHDRSSRRRRGEIGELNDADALQR